MSGRIGHKKSAILDFKTRKLNSHNFVLYMNSTNAIARKKFDRWSSRLADSSDDVRNTAIEMIAEVGRDDLALRESVVLKLGELLLRRPNDRQHILYQIKFNLEECVASHLGLMSAIIKVSNSSESGGVAIGLLWKLIDTGRLTVGYPLLREVNAAAAEYLRAEAEDDRAAAFQIVDWCEDNLG